MPSSAISLGRGFNIFKSGGTSGGGALDPEARAYCDNALIFGQTPIQYDNAASIQTPITTSAALSISSNSSLQIGGTSFSFALWAKLPSTSTGQILAKTTSSGGITCEYEIEWNPTYGLFFYLSDGSVNRSVNVLPSSVPQNQWVFLVFSFDLSATRGSIVINGTNTFTSNLGLVPRSTNLPVTFFSRPSGSSFPALASSFSHFGFWKRVLTSDEISRLYNGGLGLPYASFDSALKTNLVSYWRLNDTADSQGTNTLTNNGSVTFNTLGPVATLYDNARSLINSFVLGIKGLGLWNNMVCWPLRASQNASSGLTALPLGGLSGSSATLSNLGAASSAWGSQGINTSPTGATVTFSRPVTTTSAEILVVSSANNTGVLIGPAANIGRVPLATFVSNIPYLNAVGIGTTGVTGATALNNNFNSIVGSWFGMTDATAYAQWSINGGSLATKIETVSAGYFVPNPSANYGLAQTAGTWFANTSTFALRMSIVQNGVTQAQALALHNILKSTICQGLGLP